MPTKPPKCNRIPKVKPTTRGYPRAQPANRLSVDTVIPALVAANGLLAPAAERLCVSRSTLRRFIGDSARCQRVVVECREELCDLAETGLRKLIEQGNPAAITFALSTLGKARGWILPKGTPLSGGDSTTIMVKEIHIQAVPAGKFLSAEEAMQDAMEHRPGAEVLHLFQGGRGGPIVEPPADTELPANEPEIGPELA